MSIEVSNSTLRTLIEHVVGNDKKIMGGRRIHGKLRILKDPIRRSSVKLEKIFMRVAGL